MTNLAEIKRRSMPLVGGSALACWSELARISPSVLIAQADQKGNPGLASAVIWRFRLRGETHDERSASAQADRPFRRQHPVGGRRDGVPYPIGSDRTTPKAPAGRRDRHPEDLDRLSPPSAGG